MKANTYARLLSFANTTLGKAVSIIVAIAMVYSLTSVVYAVDVAVDAWADDEEVAAAVDGSAENASISFTAQNCVIDLAGQQVLGTIAVSAGSGVSFTVTPEAGYEIYSVSAFDSLGALPLEGGDGWYAIDGAFVYGPITVEAIAAADPDNPQDSTPTTPIEEGTVVDDGQIIPEPLLPAPVISLEDAYKSYDGLPLEEVSYSVEGLAEGDRIVLECMGSQTDVGSSPISVMGYSILRGDQDVTTLYEPAELPSATLTVVKSVITIFTPSATKTYDGEVLTYEGTEAEGDIAHITNLWSTDEVVFTVTGSQTNVGSSPNTYSIEWISGNPNNYEIQEELGELVVLPSTEAAFIIAPSASKTYDGRPIDPGSISWAGLPEGHTVEASFEGSATDASVVPTRILEDTVRIYNAAGEDVTSFFPIETIDGELVIDRAPLSVFTESASKNADGTPLTALGAISGFVNGETATFSVVGSQADRGVSVNNYRIDWDGTAKESNYEIFEDLGVLEVVEPLPVQEEPVEETPAAPAVAPAEQPAESPAVVSDPAPVENIEYVEHIEYIEYIEVPAEPEQVVVYANEEPASAPASEAPNASDSGNSSNANAGEATAASTASNSNTGGPDSTSGEGEATTGTTEGSESSINPAVEAVATGMQNLEQIAIGDEPTPLAAPATGEEVVADNETPLGVFDEPVNCWVHWYAILGLIATIIYGAVVMFFRRAYSYELESREAAILGVPTGSLQQQVPASSGGKAGKEA